MLAGGKGICWKEVFIASSSQPGRGRGRRQLGRGQQEHLGPHLGCSPGPATASAAAVVGPMAVEGDGDMPHSCP